MKAVDPFRLVRARLGAEGGSIVLLDAAGDSLARHQGPSYVAAAGKGACAMAHAVAETIGPAARGDGIGPEAAGHAGGITMHQGGHPLPSAGGLAATNVILQAIGHSAPHTLVLVLLSGGASAMLVRPAPGLTLEQKVAATNRLLGCGASIAEINVVRKHLSAVKGGGIARHAGGRSVWGLILSDVIGDDIGTIGSGPTAPDPSSFGDALDVVARYGLEPELPPPVVEHLRKGLAGRRPETPKAGEPCFENVRNEVIGSNGIALDAAAACASERGFRPLLCDAPVKGDTTEAGTHFAAELVRTCNEVSRPTCVLAGGETTVRLKGAGKGGRNQEFALAAALVLDGVEGVELLSAGTDGIDGPTDAAGAFANGRTIGEARARGLDPGRALATNDSYSFFEALGHLFRPGPTGTNVMDLKIALLSPRPDSPVRGGSRGSHFHGAP